MTSIEKPVYLITRNDKWLTIAPAQTSPAFGTRELANEFAKAMAEQEDGDTDQFRVVEYVFGAKVYEVS